VTHALSLSPIYANKLATPAGPLSLSINKKSVSLTLSYYIKLITPVVSLSCSYCMTLPCTSTYQLLHATSGSYCTSTCQLLHETIDSCHISVSQLLHETSDSCYNSIIKLLKETPTPAVPTCLNRLQYFHITFMQRTCSLMNILSSQNV
jgi:hypothetical protein